MYQMMKKVYTLLYGMVLVSFSCTTPQSADQQTSSLPEATNSAVAADTNQKTTYRNPVLDKNFADPTIIRAADGYYYGYGTNTEENGKTIHIQVVRSKNLVDWEWVGDALPEKPSWADEDFWAPHVKYDESAQTYYLYYSGESKSAKLGKCLGVATSKHPRGPFVDRGTPLLCGEEFVNIDPMAFDDPATGRKWLYWGSGFKPIKVQELTADRLHFTPGSVAEEVVPSVTNGNPDNYENLIEGAWVIHRNGYYYLFYSGDNCCGEKAHYAVMVARSRSVTGPFEKAKEIILHRNNQWLAPGHNSVITDAAGQDWMVYHAIDPARKNKGRVMLMDKIDYRDGWPYIETASPSVVPKPVPVIK